MSTSARLEMLENWLNLYQPQTQKDIPHALSAPMHYSLSGGGKRIRPMLCLTAASMCAHEASQKGQLQAWQDADILPFAGALEMIHTYSLIHDDLPCMDNDDFRRGKASCHKAFGEANALLAADALLTDAFAYMAQAKVPAPQVLEAMALVARACGSRGMVGGQVLDMQKHVASETTMQAHVASEQKIADIARMNALKTGALLQCACEAGAVLAQASSQQRQALADFGAAFGMVFQITDDLLDVEGDAAIVGKSVGKDQAQGKAAWPSVLDLESCRKLAFEHVEKGEAALAFFSGPDVEYLRHLLRQLLQRSK